MIAIKSTTRQAIDPVYQMSVENYQAALRFLKQPDLLDRISADLNTLGITGLNDIKTLVYLIVLSIYLPRPLCATIVGESACGKSYLVKNVLSLFPQEDIFNIARFSRFVLYYMPKSLSHKLLFINESEGIRRQPEALYSLRLLESENVIKLLVTSGRSFDEKIVEGPIGVLETCVHQKTFLTGKENDSRHLTINLNSDPEQNSKILNKIKESYLISDTESKKQEIILKHSNAIRILKKHTADIVVIPYAGLLTFPLCPQAITRTFNHMMSLIQTSAFLHQFQRQRIYKNGRPRILADVKDYEYVYNLLGRVLVITLMPVYRKSLILLKCIEENFADKEFTRSDLVEEISWAARSVHRYVRHLSDVLEVIEVTGGTGQQGSCLTYRLKKRNGNISSPKLEQILTPDELKERIKKEGLPDLG